MFIQFFFLRRIKCETCVNNRFQSAPHSFEWEIRSVVHIVNHAVDFFSTADCKKKTRILHRTAEARISHPEMGLISVKTCQKPLLHPQVWILDVDSALDFLRWKIRHLNIP